MSTDEATLAGLTFGVSTTKKIIHQALLASCNLLNHQATSHFYCNQEMPENLEINDEIILFSVLHLD